MPKQTHYPSGPIAVEDAQLRDMSAGMNWNMPDASEVRFLAVRGTLWVGDCRTTYDFMLVEYHLHIDEIPCAKFRGSGGFGAEKNEKRVERKKKDLRFFPGPGQASASAPYCS